MRPHSLKTSAHAFLAIVAAGFLTVAPTVPTVLAQDSGASGGSAVADAESSVSVLLTRQNERTRLLEEDMQGLRGLVETDLRALKMQITQLSNNASSDETTTSGKSAICVIKLNALPMPWRWPAAGWNEPLK